MGCFGGGASTDDPKSKRPANTAFKQQNLKAWRPILTPKAVIITFFCLGLLFVPIGVIVIITSSNVVEVSSANYDAEATAGGCCISNCSSTRAGERVDLNPCVVSINVTKDMEPPIYMHYKLTHFYQNHRMYVKSRDDSQLNGKVARKPSDTEDNCVYKYAANYDKAAADYDTTANVVSPCGLIAFSVFNDSFRMFERGEASQPIEVAQDSKGISWESDRSNKFHNAEDGSTGLNYAGFHKERSGTDCDVLPSELPASTAKAAECVLGRQAAVAATGGMDPGWCYTGSGFCTEDEHFIVWMRTAGLPSFRKLYAHITQRLEAGKQYYVQISNGYAPGRTGELLDGGVTMLNSASGERQSNLFPVHTFHGEKYIVLTTTAWIGGKNDFLGYSYLIVGVICIVLSLGFLLKDRISPREFGGPTISK